jgi:glycosyltransferase involved in cell wall biosynthesis
MKLELESSAFDASTTKTSETGLAPLRIAFLSYRSDPKVGGQGIFVHQVAAALARRGHIVSIISGPPYPIVPVGVRLVPVPSLDLYAQPHLGRRALRPRHFRSRTDLQEFFGHHSGKFMEPKTFGSRAKRYLRANAQEYDVVLDNQSLSDALPMIARSGLPVVGIVHHPIHNDRRLALAAEPRCGRRWLIRRWYSFLPMQERVARALDNVIVVSETAGRDACAELGVRPEALHVVPPGVDKSYFRPRPEVARHVARLVSTASADVPLKGLRFLLEAFGVLARTRPELELVLVGQPRAEDTVRYIAELGVGEQLRFVQNLSTEEMACLFASATICVTPSLYEGFGLPAAEAMACGTCVIVTDGGALPETVGDAGVVVPRGDAKRLAQAIGDLLDDPAERARLGAAGLVRADQRYSWDLLAARYETILRGALAQC